MKETPIYVGIAVLLAVIVLSLTMDSYLIPLFFLLSIGMAIVYNMGSNVFEKPEWFANLYDTIQKGFFRYPTMPMAPEVESQKGDIVKADMIAYVYRLISCPTDQFDSLEAELHANLINAGLNEIIEARGTYYDQVNAK